MCSYFIFLCLCGVDRLQALVKGVFADFTIELAATSRDDLGEETLITAVKRANY